MRGIQPTGINRIDGAAAEIAGHIRDGRVGSHGGWSEQDHYDEATRLRDEIIAGARTLVLTELAGELLARSGGNDAAREPKPQVLTDDIVLNLAATVLDAMGHEEVAAGMRLLLPKAEGKVFGKPYQEPVVKWKWAGHEAG
jgi:hypothetical protein